MVHLVDNEEELSWLEKSGNAGPYAAVVPFSMFTRDTLIRLKNTENINGVLLASNESFDRPEHYSPEDTCPNRYSGFKQCRPEKPWNPLGSALLLEDWPFPMFYLKVILAVDSIFSSFRFSFN